MTKKNEINERKYRIYLLLRMIKLLNNTYLKNIY